MDTAGCEILVSQEARVQRLRDARKTNRHLFVDDRAKISIAGDWGTRTDEARIVATGMEKSDAEFTIQLEDVYDVGDPNEVRENFLGERASPYTPVKWLRSGTRAKCQCTFSYCGVPWPALNCERSLLQPCCA
jgi:hypothetical protein